MFLFSDKNWKTQLILPIKLVTAALGYLWYLLLFLHAIADSDVAQLPDHTAPKKQQPLRN